MLLFSPVESPQGTDQWFHSHSSLQDKAARVQKILPQRVVGWPGLLPFGHIILYQKQYILVYED